MTYEAARDAAHIGLSPIEAASEYLRIFALDGGLAAGFRVGLRRRLSVRAYADFRRFVKLIEG